MLLAFAGVTNMATSIGQHITKLVATFLLFVFYYSESGSSGEKIERIAIERIAGVVQVHTIMDAAQTRFFARAVADPSAIGDHLLSLTMILMNCWRRMVGIGNITEHIGFNTIRRMSILQLRAELQLLQSCDSEATISWGGEVQKCEVEELVFGRGPTSPTEVWVDKINTATECYRLTARKVEGAETEYIRKVNHVLRTIVIALISQYPRRQPSLYDYAFRPSTLRSYSPSAGI